MTIEDKTRQDKTIQYKTIQDKIDNQINHQIYTYLVVACFQSVVSSTHSMM